MILSRLARAGVALFTAANLPTAFGQATSNVTCRAEYQWMINSKSHTPCLTSAYLSAQCNGGQWNVPTLGNGGPYGAPTGAAANLCRCNTVVYNLIQACSVCQGGVIGGWVNWISNCTAGNVTVGSYPLPLPAGVAVPNWAYLDFTSQDQFQVTAAQQAAGTSPESMSSPAQTQIQTAVTSGTTNRGVTYTSTAGSTNTAAASNSGGSSSNTGPIVGGVVGGILGLGLLGLIAWFLLRKKAAKTPPPPMKETFAGHPGQPGYAPQEGGYPVQQPFGAGSYTPVPQGGIYDPGHVAYDQPYGVPLTPGTPFKPYDPSDPSTFPTTPGPGSGPTIHSQGHTAYSEYSHQPRPGQYNYAAEL